MKKRWMSLLLVLCLLFNCVVTVSAVEPEANTDEVAVVATEEDISLLAVANAPALVSASPAVIDMGSQQTITVSGTNLAADMTVKLGTASITDFTVSEDGTSVSFVAPVLPVGTYSVVVTVDGLTASLPNAVTYRESGSYIRIDGGSVANGTTLRLPVYVGVTGNLTAFRAEIDVPETKFSAAEVELAEDINASLACNYSNGTLIFSVAGGSSFNPGSEPLAYLVLTPKTVLGETATKLTLTSGKLNGAEMITDDVKIPVTICPNFSLNVLVKYFEGLFAVSGVTVKADDVSGTTDAEGKVTLSGITSSDVTVWASKNESVTGEVEAYDAVLALRHSVGLETLNEYQLIAGDVDLNGAVDEMDASLILQKAVFLIDSFPAGNWAFAPDSVDVNLPTGGVEEPSEPGEEITRDDVVYLTDDPNTKTTKDTYVVDLVQMSDMETLEDIEIDAASVTSGDDQGFYTYDLADGVYELKNNAKIVDDLDDDEISADSDGYDMAVTFTDVKNQTATSDDSKYIAVSFADAKVIDTRSSRQKKADIYSNTIDSASRLASAIDKCNDVEDGGLVADVYVEEGEIIFVAVLACPDEPVEEPEPALPENVLVVPDANKAFEELMTDAEYLGISEDDILASAPVYYNGDEIATYDSAGYVAGKGDIIEVTKNSNGDVDAIYIRSYTYAKIDKLDTELSETQKGKGATVGIELVDIDENDIGTYYDAHTDSEKILRGFDAADYEEGAVIAVAMDDNGCIIDSYVMESVTGIPTAARAVQLDSNGWVKNGTIAIDDITYTYAAQFTGLAAGQDVDFDEEYVVYLTAEGYALAVKWDESTILDDVYYLVGIYGDTLEGEDVAYAQVVSVNDGTKSKLMLDDDGDEADTDALIRDIINADGDYVAKGGFYTFDKDGTKYDVKKYNGSSAYTVINGTELVDDVTRSSVVIRTAERRLYIDDETFFLGAEGYGSGLNVTTATGMMTADASSWGLTVYVIYNRDNDAVVVVYAADELRPAYDKDDVVYLTDNAKTKTSKDTWLVDLVKMTDMETLTSVEISDDGETTEGFYTYVLEDGVYELQDNARFIDDLDDGEISDDTDGYDYDVTFTEVKGFYLSGSSDYVESAEYVAVSFADANVLDTRSDAAQKADSYTGEIDTPTKLAVAVEAGEVVANVYVEDGNITFVAIVSCENAPAEGEPDDPEEPPVGNPADLNDVYYVVGVYAETVSGQQVAYAQVIDVQDGTVEKLMLDNDGDKADTDALIELVVQSNGAYTKAGGFYTFTLDGDMYDVCKFTGTAAYDVEEDIALTDDVTRTSVIIRLVGMRPRLYIEDETFFIGAEGEGINLEVTTATGMMTADKASAGLRVYTIYEGKDAVVVVYAAEELDGAPDKKDVVYLTDDPNTKTADNTYIVDLVKMETLELLEDVEIDDNEVGSGNDQGFYAYLLNDGVYELYDKADPIDDLNWCITDDTDGYDMGVIFYGVKNSLAFGYSFNTEYDAIPSAEYDAVSFADAKVIDTRSANARKADIYSNEINSPARLTTAIDKGEVVADVYVQDGKITFVAVVGCADDFDPEEEEEVPEAGPIVALDGNVIYVEEDADKLDTAEAIVEALKAVGYIDISVELIDNGYIVSAKRGAITVNFDVEIIPSAEVSSVELASVEQSVVLASVTEEEEEKIVVPTVEFIAILIGDIDGSWKGSVE